MSDASSDPDWSRRAIIAATGGGAMLPLGKAIAATPPVAGPAVVRAGRSIAAFGARPDASGAVNLQALRDCIAACREDGAPVLVPVGRFALANDGRPIVLDLTRMERGAPRAVPVIGEGGPAHSVLHVEGRAGGLRLEGPTDWFDLVVEGIGVTGAMADTLVAIGRDDFADPVNMARLRDVAVENSFDRGAVVALRLNYLAPGSLATGLKANAYADGKGHNHGIAIECRQVESMAFLGGAASNAAIGLAVRDGVSFGIVLQGFTFENTDVGFSNETWTSGAHAVLGCQFSEIRVRAIRSTGCNRSQWIEFIANDFAVAADAILDPRACEGVRIHDRQGIGTPPLPLSETALRNTTGRTVEVRIWGGSVRTLIVDDARIGGEAYASLPVGSSVSLRPGGTIAIDYVRPPAWHWRNVG